MSKTKELDKELRPILEELYRQKGSPTDPITCMILGVRFGAALVAYEPAPDQAQPVKNPDGSIENFTVRLPNRQLYRCECGCNVFHKPDDGNLNLYRCNGCGERVRSRVQYLSWKDNPDRSHSHPFTGF